MEDARNIGGSAGLTCLAQCDRAYLVSLPRSWIRDLPLELNAPLSW